MLLLCRWRAFRCSDHDRWQAEANKGLEQEVAEQKLAEEKLQERMNELETFCRATLGREERVSELKQEVNELSEQLGKNKNYRDYSK